MKNFKHSSQKLTMHFIVVFVLSMVAHVVLSAEPVLKFETPEQAALYLQLTKDHRCLKCQNQNLADSNAGIAQDLKREIYERVVEGDSRSDVSNYLVARYGDFVLYRPPFKASTYLLWLGPIALLLAALWYAVRISRQSTEVVNEPDETSLAKARELLNEEQP